MKRITTLVMTMILAIGLIGIVPFTANGVKVSASKEIEIVVNKKNFPDKNFRKALYKELDEPFDEKNETEFVMEYDDLEELTLSGVKNFKGMELFSVIESLTIKNLKVKKFTIKKNWNIDDINFKKCKINKLYLFKDKIPGLDGDSKTKVKNLYISKFKGKKMEWNTGIEFIDNVYINSCSKLKSFEMVQGKVKKLTIKKCKKIKKVYCCDQRIKKIVIKNCPNITALICDNNHLKSLNVSKLKKLKVLDCYTNKLKKLNVSRNKQLKELCCSFNRLKKLNVKNNKKLTRLDCDLNKIKTIDIRKCKHLKTSNITCDKKVKIIK